MVVSIVVVILIRVDFILHHCLGKSIGKPDILSWRPDYGNSLYDNENMILLKLEYLTVYTLKELRFEEEKYNLLINIYQETKTG